MAYIVIEASVRTHKKFLEAGPTAAWLWLCGLAYCQDGLTDGFIPKSALPFLGVENPRRHVQKLVDARLWDELADGSGWQLHDYLEHNKSADEVRRVMRERAEGGVLGGRPRAADSTPEKPGVYFVQLHRRVKIGYATNLRARTRSQRVPDSTVAALIIEASTEDASRREALLHGEFADLREKGEWFRLEPKLVEFIQSIPGSRLNLNSLGDEGPRPNPLLPVPTGTTLPTDPTGTESAPRDAGGRALAEGGAWGNSRAHRGGLINGSSQRLHGNHAWCSPRGALCVHQTQHEDFLGRLGTPDADAELRAWYPTVIARYAGMPVGDDSFEFWRNEFAAWVGTVTRKPSSGRESAAEHTLRSAREVLRPERPGRSSTAIDVIGGEK